MNVKLWVDIVGIYSCLFFQTENQRALIKGIGASLPFTLLLLQSQYFFAMFVSTIYTFYANRKYNTKIKENTKSDLYQAHLTIFSASFFQVLSQGFSYTALKTVEFPVRTLFRSCKPITVVIFAFLVSSIGTKYVKKPRCSNYAQALSVILSIYVFNKVDFERKGKEFRLFSSKDDGSDESQGVTFLVISLIFDGIVNTIQSYRRNKYKERFKNFAFAWFWENFYQSVIILFIRWFVVKDTTYTYTNLFSLLQGENGKSLFKYFFICISLNSIGQLFIYHRMNTPGGSFTLSLILTIRKLFSFLFGVLFYQYFGSEDEKSSSRLEYSQWICVGIIFGSLMLEKMYKFYKKKDQVKSI